MKKKINRISSAGTTLPRLLRPDGARSERRSPRIHHLRDERLPTHHPHVAPPWSRSRWRSSTLLQRWDTSGALDRRRHVQDDIPADPRRGQRRPGVGLPAALYQAYASPLDKKRGGTARGEGTCEQRLQDSAEDRHGFYVFQLPKRETPHVPDADRPRREIRYGDAMRRGRIHHFDA